jgi:hypothetical protein
MVHHERAANKPAERELLSMPLDICSKGINIQTKSHSGLVFLRSLQAANIV